MRPMPRRRRRIRRVFLALFVLLPVQYALVGVVSVWKGQEPWPALVMPGFKQVWHRGETVRLEKASLLATFVDGSSQAVEAAALLSPIPRSHHRALLELQFKPLGRGEEQHEVRAAQDEVKKWVVSRLEELYPGRKPAQLEVVWFTLEVRVEAAGAEAEAVPLDTLRIPLAL